MCQVGTKVGPSWGQVGAKLGQVGAKLGQVGAKMGQVGAKCGPSWGRWTKMEVKIAKIGQHRPKMRPKSPKSTEDCRGLSTVAEGGSSPEA